MAPATTWLGYPLDDNGMLHLTPAEWNEGKRRFIGWGLKLVAFTFTPDRRDAVIHIIPSNGPSMSGSFVIGCQGLDGAIKDEEELRKVALAAVKSLGWTWFKVSDRRVLETAFGEVDYNCLAEGKYRTGEVDVLLEGHGIDAQVPELDKFDLGFRLTDGKVRIYGISRSGPNSTANFRSKFDRFEDTFQDFAAVNQLTEGLPVDLSQVQWSENHDKATIKVSSGFGIQ